MYVVVISAITRKKHIRFKVIFILSQVFYLKYIGETIIKNWYSYLISTLNLSLIKIILYLIRYFKYSISCVYVGQHLTLHILFSLIS